MVVDVDGGEIFEQVAVFFKDFAKSGSGSHIENKDGIKVDAFFCESDFVWIEATSFGGDHDVDLFLVLVVRPFQRVGSGCGSVQTNGELAREKSVKGGLIGSREKRKGFRNSFVNQESGIFANLGQEKKGGKSGSNCVSVCIFMGDDEGAVGGLEGGDNFGVGVHWFEKHIIIFYLISFLLSIE